MAIRFRINQYVMSKFFNTNNAQKLNFPYCFTSLNDE